MATVEGREFCFINGSGDDVTGTEEVAGYLVQDFFTCDIRTATDEEIRATYKGPDSEGIGVRWMDLP
jgi:hypothetical protein